MNHIRTPAGLIAVAMATGLLGAACSGDGGTDTGAATGTPVSSTSPRPKSATIPQPPLGKLAKLPIADARDRVDLGLPTFSRPLQVTNPLFPISRLQSAVMLGMQDGEPMRVEVTLLPNAKPITWNGREIRALESQYVAFVGGRLHEVALDWYAQADDGSVWYLGEDVFNYERGVIADTDGTWRTGEDGPAAMIMPARPQAGDVYRPENIPGVVFEEVVVKATGKTVAGPRGPVEGAIVVRELHQDGTTEAKTFAPGYGEFSTGAGKDFEDLALAVPTDSLEAPVPSALATLAAGADNVFRAARAKDWTAATAAYQPMAVAWQKYRATSIPGALRTQLSDALTTLARAVEGRRAQAASRAALDVAHASLDLQLRYLPPAEVDRARFDVWARQLVVDAAAGNKRQARGDVTTLEWIRDRLAGDLDEADLRKLDADLRYLRAAADAGELAAVTEAAGRLRTVL